MGQTREERRVDQSALKVNQTFIIGLTLLAFIADSWVLVAFVAAVMLVGTLFPPASLFKRIYRHLLRPAGLVKANVIADNPEPHRFAQGLGGIFLALSALLLWLGQPLAGWALAWVVIILAGLNLFLGFCAGCFMYYQLNRLGVPGFRHSPVAR
jgi:hypothetical protein